MVLNSSTEYFERWKYHVDNSRKEALWWAENGHGDLATWDTQFKYGPVHVISHPIEGLAPNRVWVARMDDTAYSAIGKDYDAIIPHMFGALWRHSRGTLQAPGKEPKEVLLCDLPKELDLISATVRSTYIPVTYTWYGREYSLLVGGTGVLIYDNYVPMNLIAFHLITFCLPL